MFERLLRRDRIEFIARQFPKWSTGRGKNNAPYIGNVQRPTVCIRCWMFDCLLAKAFGVVRWTFSAFKKLAFQTLKNRVVFAVHWQNMHAVLTRFAHHDLACHYENFLARHREILSSFNRSERRS